MLLFRHDWRLSPQSVIVLPLVSRCYDYTRKEERCTRVCRPLTGSPLINQLSMAAGFDFAEVQLNCTTSLTW